MKALAPRPRTAKVRCRRVISMMPAGRPAGEDVVQRAIVELVKAQAELETELQALKVQRAKAAKKRIPRAGMKDARGRKRGGGNLPGYNTGRKPGNAGKTYGKTPPSTHEVLRMLDLAPSSYYVRYGKCAFCGAYKRPHEATCMNPYSERLRALIYLLWRGGFRIACEALRLTEADLYPTDGYIHIERGKGGKSRDVAIDDWVWPRIEPWLRFRQQFPPGPLFCVIEGPTAGRTWDANGARNELHRLAAVAGVRRRCAPHQLRHAMAVDQLDDGVNVLYVSRQLGHANLAITTTYLEGLPQSRVIKELRGRPVPKVSLLDLLGSAGRGDEQPRYARQETSSPDLMGALS